MLQQNNNNNYPCLEMSGTPREVLQKCQKSNLPFTSRLELGDMPLVKGLRAWAVCSKNRRRAVPSPRAPGFCPRPADVYPVGQWGRLGYGLGLPMDSNYASNTRQGGLGALVTVATLKASEGGGQTQTRCLFLKTEGGRRLYSTGSPKACTLGLVPQSPSALVGSWLRDKVGGGIRDSSTGKMGAGDMGGVPWVPRVKPRPVRKWRTSCKPAIHIQERTHQSGEDAGVDTLEGGQENGDKAGFPNTDHISQSGKQDRGTTKTPKCCHALTKICTQCQRRRGGHGSGGGGGGGGSGGSQKGAAAVGVQDHSSEGVEGIKEKGEEEEDGSTLNRLKLCDSCLPPADPENQSSSGGDARTGGQLDGTEVQRGTNRETSHDRDYSLDKLEDTNTHTGDKDVANGVIMRHAEDLDVGDINGFVDHMKSTKVELDWLEGNKGIVEAKLPNRWIQGKSPDRHCCSEKGCLPFYSATLPPSPAGGSISTADVKTSCSHEKKQEHGEYDNERHKKDLPVGEDPLAVGQEESNEFVSELCGEEFQSTTPKARDPCEEHEETLSEARLVEAMEEHESEEKHRSEERCISALPASLTEEGEGGGWREAEAGQTDNSPSRGLVTATGPAASVTQSPPNPAPLGAMATGLPAAREWGQTDAGGGGAPVLPASPEEQEQEQERGPDEGSKVAANKGLLDGGQKGEKEDDFGLFMQAGEQPPWDAGFTASTQVPCGKSESVAPANHSIAKDWTSGWTDSSFNQPEDTWTAFSNDLVEEEQEATGQWWPTNAAEDTSRSAGQNVDNVFLEAFPSLSAPSCESNAVSTLTQLLRGVLDQGSSAEVHGLLDGYSDLNKMIGLKYKRANVVSREHLLQSLHLDQSYTDNVTGPRTAYHSPSGFSSSNQHAQGTGKRRLSYDLNKNIRE